MSKELFAVILIFAPLWVPVLITAIILPFDAIETWRGRRELARWRAHRASHGIYHDTLCHIPGETP